MFLFIVLLLKKPPDQSLDYWHIPSKKPVKPMASLPHGRHRCIFSTLNSAHNNDHFILPFTSTHSDQLNLFNNNIMTAPAFPRPSSRLKYGMQLLSRWLVMSLSDPATYSSSIFFTKYLSGLKFVIHPPLMSYFQEVNSQ